LDVNYDFPSIVLSDARLKFCQFQVTPDNQKIQGPAIL